MSERTRTVGAGLLAAMLLAVSFIVAPYLSPVATAQNASMLIRGVDPNGIVRTITLNTSGQLTTFAGTRATYAAATTTATATAAGTAPFFAICGSATTIVRVQEITISGSVGTAAVYGAVVVQKTSTATSAGTPVALTAVPFDSTSAAATAGLVNFYSALATTGTVVGTIGQESASFPITATIAPTEALLDFNWYARVESEAPTLRGTAQCLQAAFGTTTTNAPTLSVQVVWTEAAS